MYLESVLSLSAGVTPYIYINSRNGIRFKLKFLKISGGLELSGLMLGGKVGGLGAIAELSHCKFKFILTNVDLDDFNIIFPLASDLMSASMTPC